MVGMLRDLVGIVGPTEERPLTVHTDGGAVYTTLGEGESLTGR